MVWVSKFWDFWIKILMEFLFCIYSKLFSYESGTVWITKRNSWSQFISKIINKLFEHMKISAPKETLLLTISTRKKGPISLPTQGKFLRNWHEHMKNSARIHREFEAKKPKISNCKPGFFSDIERQKIGSFISLPTPHYEKWNLWPKFFNEILRNGFENIRSSSYNIKELKPKVQNFETSIPIVFWDKAKS